MPVYKMSRKDAKKARDRIKQGDVVYTIETSDTPLKAEQLIKSWRFDGYCHLMRVAKCGHMSPEYLVLNYGPVYTEHPSPNGHIRCLFEDDAQMPELHVTPDDLMKIRAMRDKKRKTRA